MIWTIKSTVKKSDPIHKENLLLYIRWQPSIRYLGKPLWWKNLATGNLVFLTGISNLYVAFYKRRCRNPHNIAKFWQYKGQGGWEDYKKLLCEQLNPTINHMIGNDKNFIAVYNNAMLYVQRYIHPFFLFRLNSLMVLINCYCPHRI